MGTPHDALFRMVFSRPVHAAALARCALPAELVAAVAWHSLAPVPTEFINGRLRGLRADLLFVCRLKVERSRRVYLLYEHTSRPRPRTVAQGERYAAQVFQRHREVHPHTPDPAVIVVLVCHDRRARHGGRNRKRRAGREKPPAVIAPFLEDSRVVRFDIDAFDEAGIRALAMPALPRLCMLCLGGLSRRPVDVEAALRRWLDLLGEVRTDDAGSGLEAISWYIHFATRLTTERLARLFDELLGPEAGETPVSTGARIEREARKRGREEGREEGRIEQLLDQLRARFGAEAKHVEARVRAGSSADLARWAIAVLTARTIDEVFGGDA